MSTPAKKIVIKGRAEPRDGNAAYQKLKRMEYAERQLRFKAILKWERGFSPEDAPPDLR